MTLRSFDDANSDEARHFLLDRRCERSHPKRHRTKGRARRFSAAKRQRAAHNRALAKAARQRWLIAARAYWAGERNAHP